MAFERETLNLYTIRSERSRPDRLQDRCGKPWRLSRKGDRQWSQFFQLHENFIGMNKLQEGRKQRKFSMTATSTKQGKIMTRWLKRKRHSSSPAWPSGVWALSKTSENVSKSTRKKYLKANVARKSSDLDSPVKMYFLRRTCPRCSNPVRSNYEPDQSKSARTWVGCDDEAWKLWSKIWKSCFPPIVPHRSTSTRWTGQSLRSEPLVACWAFQRISLNLRDHTAHLSM